MRVSDMIAYLGKDRDDAIDVGIIGSHSIFDSKIIGRSNAQIINNMTVDIVNNSYRKDHIAMSEDAFHDIVDRVFLHFTSADGRYGLTDARIKQTEIFVDFSACADRASWIAGYGFLLNGDGGRQTFYVVALGLVHPAQKLTGVGTQRLHIAALALGKQRVECQRRLAAARHAGNHDELITRYA